MDYCPKEFGGEAGGDKKETKAGEGIGVKTRVLMTGKCFLVGGDDSIDGGKSVVQERNDRIGGAVGLSP